MKEFRLSVTICLLFIAGTIARNLPRYDLDDFETSEIRDILSRHLSSKHELVVNSPKEVPTWGLNVPLGQIGGLTTDLDGNPIVFHRGTRTWHQRSFNWTHHFQENGQISEDVILKLDAETGTVLESWGKDLFYLPHGIHSDTEGNIWVTDVGSHQVHKFEKGSKTPSLTLGEKLMPGSDAKHFCQPTSVAVASSGEFFVADGYCNSRIIKYASDGSFIDQFGYDGIPKSVGVLSVPHGLAHDESNNILCIADRENKRILCIRDGLKENNFGDPVIAIQEPSRTRVFDIAFINNGLVGVAGSDMEGVAMGFTVDGVKSMQVVDEWAPYHGFRNPHAIAVSSDQSALYVGEIEPKRIWKFKLEDTLIDNERKLI